MNFKNIFMIIIVLFVALGISTVSATDISDDNNQLSISDDSISDVNEADITNIVANNVTYKNGDDKIYSVDLLSNGTGVPNQNVSFIINGEFQTNATTNENGTAFLNVEFLEVGKYAIDVNFDGNDQYQASSAQATVNVFNSIVAEDITKYYKNDTQFEAVLFDENGNPLVGEVAQIKINGQTYNRTTDNNGKIRFNINLNPGVYPIEVSNPITQETLTRNVTVLPVIEGNDTVLYYKNGTRYVAKFLDGQGNPLVGKDITFNINGVMYDRQTDKNGAASIAINLNPDTYIITSRINENGATYSNNITVLPVIEGNDTVLYYKNGTRYVAKFLDGQGNPLVNKNVTFNINGVMYNRVTNENGTASIAINLNPGKYIITSKNLENGALYSNNITVLSTIVASNYKTTYLTGGKFTFKVVDGQGNPLANQKAKLNINGVFYDRTTDENGTASLTINLRPADYICTVTANGLSQSYTVTVNKGTPSLSLVSTTVKTGDKFQCKISYNGKPVAGTLIYFIFNGTTPYGAYSDSNGIAGVTIGLPAGNYLFYVGTQNDPLFTNTLIGTTLVVK